jgi:sulfopropanediol 3-dehydrogenase
MIVKKPVTAGATRVSRPEIVDTVAQVIADVRANGDTALRHWSEKFDSWSPESCRIGPDQIAAIVSSVPETVLDDLRFAQRQVRGFAEAQRDSLTDFEVETLPGVFLGQLNIPIGAAGAYVPGGRYPLTASAHMTVVTAKVAGVDRVVATTPPGRGAPPAVSIAAMHLAGADEIYVMGGVQAVAALALGTETISPVEMLAGPGNAYVAEAKRQLYGEVGIDLFAGPTEVLIVADETADPFVVTTDLLSQAEHGPDSPAVLITTSAGLARRTIEQIEELLPNLPTRETAGQAWRDCGEVHVVADLASAFELADDYASEHVQILTAEPRAALDRMHNYGALHGRTLGRQVPEDHYLPGDPGRAFQRGAGRDLRTRLAAGELRRPRSIRRHPRGPVRVGPARLDRPRLRPRLIGTPREHEIRPDRWRSRWQHLRKGWERRGPPRPKPGP